MPVYSKWAWLLTEPRSISIGANNIKHVIK